MKRILTALAFAAAFVVPALAQTLPFPQPGITYGYWAKATYSAAFFGLVPAASATDLVCIAGSATKTVKVMQVKLSGTAGTLITTPLQLLRRASADTGGTAGSTTANPANTISLRDTIQAAATATLIAYTANPTIVDTAPTYVDSQSITLPVSGTTAASVVPTTFEYGMFIEDIVAPPTLRGIAQQICVNAGAVSISSGVINGVITWTEE
jgi:hypothetical protein